MDSSKSIATSRQLSYLIVALGLIAFFFLGWIKHAEEPRARTISYLEKVVVVSDILSRGEWTSGKEITPYALLATFGSDITEAVIASANSECAKTPPEEAARKRSSGFSIRHSYSLAYMPPLSHFDIKPPDIPTAGCKVFREQLLGMHPLVTSADRVPNARLFAHATFPHDNVFGCSFLVFRGTDDHDYNIPALYILGARRAIRGSDVYTVFFHNCLGQDPQDPPVPFMIIDDTHITGSWYSGIPGWAAGSVSKAALEDAPDDWIDDPRFDMRALLTKFQHEYLDNLIRLIPDTVYIVDVEAVLTAIIAEAARQDGVLYTKADWEKAVDKLFTMSREKPDFLGVKLQPELAIDLAPPVMFWLTVLLWHSVRRIDFSKKPFEEPWILTDIHGRLEGVLAAVWAMLMLVSVVAVFWTVLVYNHAVLPRPGVFQFFWKFPEARDFLLNAISWKATIGGFVLVVGLLPLICVIHMILRGEARLYNGLIARIQLRWKRLFSGRRIREE